MKSIKNKQVGYYEIYGINGCYNIYNAKKIQIINIDLMQGSNAEKKTWIKELLKNKKIHVQRMSKDFFLKKYPNKRTQGIVIKFKGKVIKTQVSLSKNENSCYLAMNNIEDPQNFGQIIRTAECAGIDGIIFPENKNAQISDSVLQVSQGAFLNIPLYLCGNLHQELRKLKANGFWIIGVENSIQAKYWCEFSFNRRLIIVMGSEGKGLSPLIKKTCDELITIPMQGKTNSLNVSSATSIILFERLRQVHRN